MTKLRYIGNKEEKTDPVAKTGVIWRGNGDVQDVSKEAAAKLLVHTGIWELASPKEKVPVIQEEEKPLETEQEKVDALPPMPSLENMDKEALQHFAQRHFGHEFHFNTGEASMVADKG